MMFWIPKNRGVLRGVLGVSGEFPKYIIRKKKTGHIFKLYKILIKMLKKDGTSGLIRNCFYAFSILFKIFHLFSHNSHAAIVHQK